jgi:hypothetical protein
MEADMPKKKMQVTLKPIALNIEKTIKALSGFQKKVSPEDSAKIDLKIESLRCALKDVRAACGDKKMTPGFLPK